MIGLLIKNALYSHVQATCLPCLFLHEIQRLPSRLYLILYIWANSLPMPPACRPWVPTRVMKWSERRSICRNSFTLSGSTDISGHHAPSPSSKSNLERDRRRKDDMVCFRSAAGEGKECGRRKIRTGWRGKGERKVKSECSGGFCFVQPAVKTPWWKPVS